MGGHRLVVPGEVAKPKRMRYPARMGTVPKVASMTADEREAAVVRDYVAGEKSIQQIQDEFDLTSPSSLYRILSKHNVKPGRANGTFDVTLKSEDDGHAAEGQASSNGTHHEATMPTITGTLESDETDGPEEPVEPVAEPQATPQATSPSVDREGGAVRPRSGHAPAELTERRSVFANRPLSPRVAAAMQRVPTPPPAEQVEMRATVTPPATEPSATGDMHDPRNQQAWFQREAEAERTVIDQARADVEGNYRGTVDGGVRAANPELFPRTDATRSKTYEVVVEYRTRSVMLVVAETLTSAARKAEGIESPTGDAVEVISMTLVEGVTV